MRLLLSARLMLNMLSLGTTLLSSAALAQTAAERAACQADFAKYCKGVEPGGGRIIECLAKQMEKLTPDCQKVVKAHMPK
jgi:Cysteine rich repeat